MCAQRIFDVKSLRHDYKSSKFNIIDTEQARRVQFLRFAESAHWILPLHFFSGPIVPWSLKQPTFLDATKSVDSAMGDLEK